MSTLLDTNVVSELMRKSPEDRVLPFDSDAARAYGYIAAARRSAGRPVASTRRRL